MAGRPLQRRCRLPARDNGTEFLFRGLRNNVSSVKSTAKIDLTIVEEAEDVPEASWLALEATVFRQPKAELWAIWNPLRDGSPVDQRFVKTPPTNALIVDMNWWDNPFFPPVWRRCASANRSGWTRRPMPTSGRAPT